MSSVPPTPTPGEPAASQPKPPGPAAPPAKPGASKPAAPAANPASARSSQPRGGSKPAGSNPSAMQESGLRQSIVKRGLATPEEVDACIAQRDKHPGATKDTKGLLEVMVATKVLTASQAQRLLRELSSDAPRKFEVPGYEIIDRLGKGSMGIVYKARQTSVDRIVAVKVLLDVLAKNAEFITRFEREAKIAARLSHNNIVNAIDAGDANGLYYFVMEYVEGINIKDELEKGKIYEEREALNIILAVAEAIRHAHSRGLIHRDIKPENIILTKDGGVKLADLGLARLTADEATAAAEAGMAIGTPYYISPEQVRGLTDIDIRTDIYSLGATLYHMVTGRVPFPGDSPTEVMKKHVNESITLTPPDHLNTRLSSGIGVVVETMMARNRDLRYRSPDDVIVDLRSLLRGERPMIADQRADDLASLAEGDEQEGEESYGPAVDEAERVEMAGYVNSRNTIIAVLSILLGLSVASNLLLLVAK